MFQKLSLSIAFIAICVLNVTARAQSTDGQANGGGASQVELASYGQNYATSAAGVVSGNLQTPQAMAYGQTWGGAASNRDCGRFNHYPYVYYPQNFRGEEYYKSSDSLYYRYRPEMQIPVYNRHWHNYYPSSRRYHWGHHFILDVF